MLARVLRLPPGLSWAAHSDRCCYGRTLTAATRSLQAHISLSLIPTRDIKRQQFITLYLAPVRRAGRKKNKTEIPERYLAAYSWLKGSEELARASFRAGWLFWLISGIISRPHLTEAPGEGLEEFRGEEGHSLPPSHTGAVCCAPPPPSCVGRCHGKECGGCTSLSLASA